jgi:cytochrome c-type biogenesis protein
MASAGRNQTFLHALAFVLGFSTVFVVLGASVAFVGYALNPLMPMITKIGGLLLALFGLQTMGALAWLARLVRRAGGDRHFIGRTYLSAEQHLSELLYSEGRVRVSGGGGSGSGSRGRASPGGHRLGYASSALMGVFFSAGWIPCVGPVLAGIYMLASNTETVGQGAFLLLVYSAGLGLPFLLTGAAFSTMTRGLRRLNRHAGMVSLVTGLYLIFMGALLFGNRMTLINSWIVARFGVGLAGVQVGSAGSASLVAAFVAGLLSFLSPCVLPVIPGYIGYLSGTVVAGGPVKAASREARRDAEGLGPRSAPNTLAKGAIGADRAAIRDTNGE